MSVKVTASEFYNSFSPITIEAIQQTQETCNLSNGTLTIIVSGGGPNLYYSIDGGNNYQESNYFFNLESGDYLIIVTDGFQCTQIETAQIADAPEPSIDIDYQCITGANIVNIDLISFDGIAPFEYNWIGPTGETYNSEDLTSVPPGEYFVSVTDALGCQVDSSIIVETCCELKITCNLIDSVFFDCLSDYTEIITEFLDLESVLDEDKFAFESTGAEVISSCNNIIVTASDELSEPSNCLLDSLFITRNYEIDDGVTKQYCNQTFVLDKYEGIVFTKSSSDFKVSCSDNVDLEFQDWVNNIGGATFMVCSEPYEVITVPVDPVINYSCEGIGSCEVLFLIKDNCGNIDSTFAIFEVFDEEPPTIICPVQLSIIYDNENDLLGINSWLSSSMASDGCSNTIITNDYSTIFIDGSCEQNLIVNFVAEDQCGNSNICSTNIHIENNVRPIIECPNVIEIECAENDNLQLIEDWLLGVISLNIASENLMITSDFDISSIGSQLCGDEIEVQFLAIDNCQRSSNCSSMIRIIDTTKPEAYCPEEITIFSLANNEGIISDWIDNFEGLDICGTVMLSNDFTPAILENICEYNTLEVQFLIEDECGNQNSCVSSISINQDGPQINCPNPLILACENPDMESEINKWLQYANAFDNANSNLEIKSDFNFSNLSFGCSAINEIIFIATDNCESEISCKSYIQIEDTESPDISCPDNITIDLSNDNANEDLDIWLESASSLDYCTSAFVSYDFNSDLSFQSCEKTEIVIFSSKDECENYNDCSSYVTFLNKFNVEVTCPETLVISCGNPNLNYIVNNFLNSPSLEADLSTSLSNDFDIENIDTNCEVEYTTSILFSVQDECNNLALCESQIHFIPEAKVYIPNVFSPDGDSFNDRFTVFSNSSVQIVSTLLIYNRWGSKVFESTDFAPNDVSFGWDGNYQGHPEDSYVYTYLVKIKDFFGKEFSFTGSVQIIR